MRQWTSSGIATRWTRRMPTCWSNWVPFITYCKKRMPRWIFSRKRSSTIHQTITTTWCLPAWAKSWGWSRRWWRFTSRCSRCTRRNRNCISRWPTRMPITASWKKPSSHWMNWKKESGSRKCSRWTSTGSIRWWKTRRRHSTRSSKLSTRIPTIRGTWCSWVNFTWRTAGMKKHFVTWNKQNGWILTSRLLSLPW